jgi:DsbC/DsbD-like thiol-disulfide interchange protein
MFLQRLGEKPENTRGVSMTALRIAAAAALGLSAAAPARAEPPKEAAAASPWAELHASRARLVASPAKAAGGTRLAGLEIVMDDGWKTYWRMPGDAGVPPNFDWSGSVNAADVRVLYPAPMRMAEAGGEVIGYKHAVLFPIEVTPQDATKPVALELAVEFGICRDICVPAMANLKLALPPAAGKAAKPDAVAQAVERVPRPAASRRPTDPELKQVRVEDGEPGVRLNVAAAFHGAKAGDVFVEAPEGLYLPMLRRLGDGEGGVVRFATDIPAGLARDLKGKVLTVTLVSETGATEAKWTFP